MPIPSEFPASTLAALCLIGRSEGLVKRLRGFRKDRHTLPDAVNAATQSFFARLCAEEIAEEAESWFQRTRESLAYKRRDISLDLQAATAVLTAKDFTFDLAWALNDNDPGSYTVTRTLREVRDAKFVARAECDRVFAGTFTHIVFTLSRGVAVEAVIDAIEALPESMGFGIHYPANCSECTLTVDGVAAEVRCSGATLEMRFARAGSPRELIDAFGEVRAAFRLTRSEPLSGLL